jgi:hypothetical protein
VLAATESAEAPASWVAQLVVLLEPALLGAWSVVLVLRALWVAPVLRAWVAQVLPGAAGGSVARLVVA